jgi:hypothetical protein
MDPGGGIAKTDRTAAPHAGDGLSFNRAAAEAASRNFRLGSVEKLFPPARGERRCGLELVKPDRY